MLSLHVVKRQEGFYLMERDYSAQGISPFYADLCPLTPQEASTLNSSGLVTMWNDAKVLEEAGDPSSLLSLESNGDKLVIRLQLPESHGRSAAVNIELPGFDSMLEQAAADDAKCGNLIRNTRISDARTSPSLNPN